MRIGYRITKYNPQNRNQKGHYLNDSEWTSISDIGNPKCNNLSFEKYFKTETAYVGAIMKILDEKNIENLEVDSLELNKAIDDFNDYKKSGRLKGITLNFDSEISALKNGSQLNKKQIQKVIRLILRETMWMNLQNTSIKIIFGYDYYMYVECLELTNHTINKIEDSGLFIEPNMGRKN